MPLRKDPKMRKRPEKLNFSGLSIKIVIIRI